MVKEGTPPSEVAHVSQRSRRTANKKGDAGIAITPPAKIVPLPPNLKPSSTHVVPATSGGELEWGALKITPREFECLEDGKMLNDSVIDFFLLLIKNYLAPWDGAHVFSSHFFTRLTAAGAADGWQGWSNVKGWTKSTCLSEKDCILLPINSELHWWLAAVRTHGSTQILCLDSLEDASRYDSAAHYIRGYLEREWQERPPITFSRSLVQEAMECCPTTVPQQENGWDCGVFLLENALQLFMAGRSVAGVPTWCDQETAVRRRSCLRRTLYRLQAESSGERVAVPELLARSPELVAKLRVLWGLGAAA